MIMLKVVIIMGFCIFTLFSFAGHAESIKASEYGTEYYVPGPKTLQEDERYDRYEQELHKASEFQAAENSQEEIIQYQKAFAIWPSLKMAEIIAQRSFCTGQWRHIPENLAQFPQTMEYLPIRTYFNAKYLEREGYEALSQSHWDEASYKWQQAIMQLQSLATDPHYGPHIAPWSAVMQNNILVAQENKALIENLHEQVRRSGGRLKIQQLPSYTITNGVSPQSP